MIGVDQYAASQRTPVLIMLKYSSKSQSSSLETLKLIASTLILSSIAFRRRRRVKDVETVFADRKLQSQASEATTSFPSNSPIISWLTLVALPNFSDSGKENDHRDDFHEVYTTPIGKLKLKE